MGRLIETDYVLRIKGQDGDWVPGCGGANGRKESQMKPLMLKEVKELAEQEEISEDDIDIVKIQYFTGGKSIEKIIEK